MTPAAGVQPTPIAETHLIVPADSEPQLRLAAAAARTHAQRVTGMPLLDRSGPIDLAEMTPSLSDLRANPDEFARLLSAVAWADAPGFAWLAPHPDAPVPSLDAGRPNRIGSAAELRHSLTGGAVLSIGRAERWVPCLADLHDLLTIATRTAVSTTVLTAAVPCERSLSAPTLFVGLSGSATVSLGGSAHQIEPGQCLFVRGEQVQLEPDVTASWAEMTLRSVGVTEMLAELRRRAGYAPLFRADVPPDPTGPIASWGGSLLDSPERFSESLLHHVDDSLSSAAEARWWSGLRLAPLAISPQPSRTELVLPAPPAFLDPRLCPPDLVVLATSTVLIPLDPERLEELLVLAEDVAAVPPDHVLTDTLSDLDLLRPC